MSSTYNNTKELRFWCQKVLPLVYDDSLSYYELLNKIVVYLNSTVEDVQTMIADVTRIEQGLSSKIDVSQKGVTNGVATLNGNGQVPLSQLPDISAGVQTISVNGVNVPADDNKNVNIIVMTNAVSNLVNYYLKTETYNKTEVNALIDNVKNSRFEVVAQLPTTDIQTNVIYLVPKSVGQTQNGYDEFINLDGTTSGWELIGSTDIDLSGYVTDSELATALSAYVTTQSLNTTLAGYVTSGALTTTLEGYVTQLSFQSLQNTVASQGNTLAGLITTVNGKVDKVTGKGLSTNDYSNADKGVVDKIQDNVIANTKLIKDTVGWTNKNIGKYVNQVLVGDSTIGFNIDPAGGSSLIAKLEHNKDYIVKRKSGQGDRFRVVLFINAPTQSPDKSASQAVFDNTKNEYTINSGNYNYAVFTYVSASSTVISQDTAEAMIYDADILDDTYEPYFDSTAFPRSEQAVLGAKNLLDLSRQPNRENAGVTCNIINNNQFAITGQTTGSGAVPFADESGNLRLRTKKDKQYRIIAQVLSGSFTVGSGTNTIYVRKPTTNQFFVNLVMPNNKTYSAGDIILNQTFVADSDDAVSYGAQLWVENITFNDCVIGWSMQLATDEDTGYAPYTMTNKELTGNFAGLKYKLLTVDEPTAVNTNKDTDLSTLVSGNTFFVITTLFKHASNNGYYSLKPSEGTVTIAFNKTLRVNVADSNFIGGDMKVLVAYS